MDFDPPSPYVITGIKAGWDPNDPKQQRPIRRDIDEWYSSTVRSDQDQVYLFVHALLFWQKVPNDEKISYFQVAGIHGQPLVSWDETAEAQTEGQGYCTHQSVLFPPWHRSYLLLFEQVLYEVMKVEVIRNGTWDNATRKRLNEACDTWRLPYWDAPNKNGGAYKVPQMASGKTIKIFRPDGRTENPQNPVYSYSPGGAFVDSNVNLDAVNQGDNAYGLSKATSRWANSIEGDDWINGFVDNQSIITAMQTPVPGEFPQNIHSLADAAYRLFTPEYVSNYAAFATTAFVPQQHSRDYTSLENIHNNIHDYAGGYARDPNVPFFGHMANVPVAAFDPIFWLHHCNVDRLFAIWQTLFPATSSSNYWFDTADQQLADGGTFSIQQGAIDTPTTPLAPFNKNTNGDRFDSNDVSSWLALGYTYPELQPWDTKHQENGQFSIEKYLSNVRAAVTALYDQTTQMFLSRPPVRTRLATAGADQIVHTTSSGPPKIATHDDYLVNVVYDKFHFGGRPFVINIYFNEIKVGDIYNFSAPPHTLGRGPQGCENCNRQILEGTLVTGQVPITQALWQAPGVDELDEDAVKAYLTKHLNWKVIMNNGQLVPEADYHFLKVSVAQGKGTHYRDDEVLSRFQNYEVIHAITDGKPGGLRQGDSV